MKSPCIGFHSQACPFDKPAKQGKARCRFCGEEQKRQVIRPSKTQAMRFFDQWPNGTIPIPAT